MSVELWMEVEEMLSIQDGKPIQGDKKLILNRIAQDWLNMNKEIKRLQLEIELIREE